MRVLIVDDNVHNLRILRAVLGSQGYSVVEASQGKEALAMAKAAPPDLMISDILMPVMDGFTLCREWQKDEVLSQVPFIFYTATYTDTKDRQLGLSLGAAAFLTKPAPPEILFKEIEAVMKGQGQGQVASPVAKEAEEPVFLKQYNERLVKKLEDKMAELEEANGRLENLNRALEAKVAQRTEALTIALHQAQAADRLKSKFVSDVNHELRTPLNNIMLYLGLLASGSAAKREDYLAILHREAGRLQWLIEELLDLSRLDTGELAVHLVPLSLDQIVGQLVQDRYHLVREKGLTLDFEAAEGGVMVRGDEKLLFQVLNNLLMNAVCYTKRGGITLRTDIQERDNKRWGVVEVIDTGMGIAESDLEQLFERFYRGRAAVVSGAPGTGLGLAICQEIVKRHKGMIAVDSEVGKGSCFTVYLQLVEEE
ncbi:MAG TPA: hybrid sensor histidine kinase/response regulator [Anaerolineae bacterium]|nr:hybrid sensor histidine kinase/response regulator [Anaerolineae bacterium]